MHVITYSYHGDCALGHRLVHLAFMFKFWHMCVLMRGSLFTLSLNICVLYRYTCHVCLVLALIGGSFKLRAHGLGLMDSCLKMALESSW